MTRLNVVMGWSKLIERTVLFLKKIMKQKNLGYGVGRLLTAMLTLCKGDVNSKASLILIQ